jgi:hypothetical protein
MDRRGAKDDTADSEDADRDVVRQGSGPAVSGA